jgi:hypothetical protein
VVEIGKAQEAPKLNECGWGWLVKTSRKIAQNHTPIPPKKSFRLFIGVVKQTGNLLVLHPGEITVAAQSR